MLKTQRIEYREDEMFRATKSTQPPVMWVPGLSRGKAAEVMNGFEL